MHTLMEKENVPIPAGAKVVKVSDGKGGTYEGIVDKDGEWICGRRVDKYNNIEEG